MMQAAIGTTGIIVAAGMLLFSVFHKIDFGARKMEQKLARSEKYMRMAAATLRALQDESKQLPSPTEEGFLPGDFSPIIAKHFGGQPLFQEEGRVACLDMFSPSGPFREPLLYQQANDHWLLISRGPDMDADIPTDLMALDFDKKQATAQLLEFSYDPTNGVESSGDLWIADFATVK